VRPNRRDERPHDRDPSAIGVKEEGRRTRLRGRCDAVTIAAESHLCFSRTHDMNIAGVVQIPNCTTLTFSDARPAARAADTRSLDSRGSLPMETLGAEDASPRFDFNQRANPTPI